MVYWHDSKDYENYENYREPKSTYEKRSKYLIFLCLGMMLIMSLMLFALPRLNKIFKPDITITKLNETYDGNFTITATDIKTIKRADDEIAIGVRFEITNNTDYFYSTIHTIDQYVDDVKVNDGYASWFDNGKEDLYQSGIAKGKKVMGYATAIADKDSKKVEFVFEEPSSSYDGREIHFVFDIPPVEE